MSIVIAIFAILILPLQAGHAENTKGSSAGNQAKAVSSVGKLDSVDSFWNTIYGVPEINDAFIVVLATKDPTALEAALVNVLWKSGAKKLGDGNSSYPWGFPGASSYGQHPLVPDFTQCMYRGSWKMSPEKIDNLLRHGLDNAEIYFLNRQPHPSTINIKLITTKLSELKQEHDKLTAHAPRLPGILGLVEAEIQALEPLIPQYEAFKNNGHLSICIKPQ